MLLLLVLVLLLVVLVLVLVLVLLLLLLLLLLAAAGAATGGTTAVLGCKADPVLLLLLLPAAPAALLGTSCWCFQSSCSTGCSKLRLSDAYTAASMRSAAVSSSASARKHSALSA
jgi:hypothetical protein